MNHFIVLFDLLFMTSIALRIENHLICNSIPGLISEQKRICEKKPQILAVIINGLQMASQECGHQFRDQRWNCTLMNGHNIFTHYMFKGTKETAFSYAIRSAGVSFAISKACSRGQILFCECYPNNLNDKWFGCNSFINYSIQMTKMFIDSQEKSKRNTRTLMNLHNNNVGRKSVTDLLMSRCKCHGVSGSCTLRSCWKTLPSFTTIGDHLMKKYRNAKQVVLNYNSKRSSISNPSLLRLKRISSNERRLQLELKSRDLVYLEKSSDYCEKNKMSDSFGTTGRRCDKLLKGRDNCKTLCCGRGYITQPIVVKWKCRCIFHFCCKVNCEDCYQTIKQNFCH